MGKIVLALQYWEGDKAAAMRNAKRIADNEPRFRDDAIFLFVARNDCQHDMEIVKYVSTKFRVELYTGFRRGKGWPHGCNELWCDLMQESIRRVRAGQWREVDGVLTFEADCVPVDRQWIDKLKAEWAKAKAQGKQLMGFWLPSPEPYGHINGNAVFDPMIALTFNLIGCAPDVGWDWVWGPKLSPHWMKTDLIRTLYHVDNAPEEFITGKGEFGQMPVLIHGVKDMVVENYADRIMRSDTLSRA